jgi:hypothetical protein
LTGAGAGFGTCDDGVGLAGITLAGGVAVSADALVKSADGAVAEGIWFPLLKKLRVDAGVGLLSVLMLPSPNDGNEKGRSGVSGSCNDL